MYLLDFLASLSSDPAKLRNLIHRPVRLMTYSQLLTVVTHSPLPPAALPFIGPPSVRRQ
ncbi:hypothetical protein CROQUDRAFT_97460 [Cronartium quercuum f. sp. fusiforme G11]|uniref:Uncharacterized protein n=1 Tax=Cronartium quercuum f. sp. fusiforme G11 TaxID=708437 RepID=A0A9P6T7X5_9BASI|nr:hypothetical protein CROQUDRAFT_97460 [Cronartium quercuum f. sp. fusiforme G11]